MLKNIYSVLIFLLLILLTACEDPVPADYQPRNVVEALLIVDEPIKNIILLKTQPIRDTFKYYQALIKDANVKIVEIDTNGNSQEMYLAFGDENNMGYYYPDTNFKVKPHTTYKLEVTLLDGSKIYGETKTPARFEWIKRGPKILQYPQDSVNLKTPDSIYIEWSKVENVSFYIISIKNLDTLEYGKYLNPPTEEKNRRIYRPWNEDFFFKEVNNWAFIPNTRTPVVWLSFKWYGLHEIKIFAPDENYLKWFIQSVGRGYYDYRLSSIKGNGLGVFGSASIIRDTTFVLKNQP